MVKTRQEQEEKALELTRDVYETCLNKLYPSGTEGVGWGDFDDQMAVLDLIGVALGHAGRIMLEVYRKNGFFRLK